MPTDSSLFDTLTAVQAGRPAGSRCRPIHLRRQSAGTHRSTIRSTLHRWTQNHPDFARALLAARHHRAELLFDELGELAGLALDTFRHILSDEPAPASVKFKAAI